jgi:hypothetical protein
MLDHRVSGCTAHNSLPADWWLPENKSNHCQDHADAASCQEIHHDFANMRYLT